MKKLLLIFVTVFVLFGITTNAHAIDYPFSLTTTSISSGGTFQFKMSAQGTFYVDCGTGGTLSGTGVSGTTIDRTSTTNEDTYTCTYSTSGTKTIRFGGLATAYNTNTSIPALGFSTSTRTLVSSISGNVSIMFPYLGSGAGQAPRFTYMFWECSNLREIPGTLFENYTGDFTGGAYMFASVFRDCTGITSIPENLFDGITGGSSDMFSTTFLGCTGLTSIPENLFSSITKTSAWMFISTFNGCSGLKKLPKNLFPNIRTTNRWLFNHMFANCTGLRGYVPKSMFSGLIANGSPYSDEAMLGIFENTGLDTTCPAGTTQYSTGYEQYWETGHGNAVSCEPNTVNVNWYDGDTQLSVPSASQSCVYSDALTLPTPPAAPNGYHFGGWKVKQ